MLDSRTENRPAAMSFRLGNTHQQVPQPQFMSVWAVDSSPDFCLLVTQDSQA